MRLPSSCAASPIPTARSRRCTTSRSPSRRAARRRWSARTASGSRHCWRSSPACKRLQAGGFEVLGGDMAEAAHRTRTAARIAYMPQGPGQEPLSDALGRRERRFLRPPVRPGRRRAPGTYRSPACAPRACDLPDRPAGKLSGGMKQKLALCCALIHDPDLLVLDEPTTGVDPLSRRQFWRLIDEIRAERPGMTLLVATAYMEEAERFDGSPPWTRGRVLAVGPPPTCCGSRRRSLEEAYRRLQNAADCDRAFVSPPRAPRRRPPAIVASGLTRRFGDFTAVDHVSFRIERGEIFGFLGSNGCGKTTTMKMLTGLLPATEGRAELLGRPVRGIRHRDPPARRLHVAVLLALRGAHRPRQSGPSCAALPLPGR